MATMQDVADKAGVSISTVSYVINGTRPVSEKTKELIFETMKELGYRPHAMARALASKRSRILAMLFSPIERGLGLTELEFVSSAADAARQLGYHLVLWTADVHDEAELNALSSQGLVDGVIMMEVHDDDPRVGYLRDLNLPFSMIGRTSDSRDLVYADIDFRNTFIDAVQHLAGLGHRAIAFLNQSREVFDSGYGPAVRGHESFVTACGENGVVGYPRFSHAAPSDGYEAATALLSEHPETTAIISMNERAIPGVVQAVTERGWKIPDDISLLSIVSSPRVAEMFVPALTSMDVPSEELGRLSVEYLVAALEGGAVEHGQVLVPCHLAVRGSTGIAPVRAADE